MIEIQIFFSYGLPFDKLRLTSIITDLVDFLAGL